MRLDKFLAHNGFGSRLMVKKIIKAGDVYVNGKQIKKASFKIDIDKDEVKVADESIVYVENEYIMLNKPSGYICSHDTSLYPSVLELIDSYRNDLIIVGRLDVDTEGLLLITTDGKFSHQVIHGKNNVYKTYYVELKEVFDETYIDLFADGISLDDAILKPAYVEMIDDKALYLSISEGKYHQVKRMMRFAQNEVIYLRRVKIGNLALDENLDFGEYRSLSSEEIGSITT